jgi:UMF1 family MFS transporter
MQARALKQTSWALFDFANSAFPTVITTFVFAAYFSKAVAPDEITGTALWGYATSIAAFCIALCAPVFGAIADQGGRRKVWLFFCTCLTIFATSSLWWVSPEESSILFALICVGVATFGFEMGMVFYNAMLPSLATSGREGLLSGLAWGLGYIGGLLGLVVVLLLFVQTDTPLFGLSKETAEHIRIAGPFVGVWFLVFSLPLFLFVPDQPKKMALRLAMKSGLQTLINSLKKWRENRVVYKFLIIRMIYTDGLNTLFAFGGIYAASTFNMAFDELIIFGIGINVTAGLGAALFGWLDDRWGPKKVIGLSLICLIILSFGTLIVTDKTHFLILGICLGLFIGPVQAASRTYMAHISPAHLRTEFFGLYALSGKATAFLGPLLVAFFSEIFLSQRAGMATILIFLLIGLACLRILPDIKPKKLH